MEEINVSRVYRLHFNPVMDVLDAVAVFSADPHLAYTQPNDLATSYPNQEVTANPEEA